MLRCCSIMIFDESHSTNKWIFFPHVSTRKPCTCDMFVWCDFHLVKQQAVPNIFLYFDKRFVCRLNRSFPCAKSQHTSIIILKCFLSRWMHSFFSFFFSPANLSPIILLCFHYISNRHIECRRSETHDHDDQMLHPNRNENEVKKITHSHT